LRLASLVNGAVSQRVKNNVNIRSPRDNTKETKLKDTGELTYFPLYFKIKKNSFTL